MSGEGINIGSDIGVGSGAGPDPSEVEAKVLQSLQGTPYESSSLTQLEGGTVNWAFAATLVKPLDDGTNQIFVKHGEPRLKARPGVVMDLDRVETEAECFKHLSEVSVVGEASNGGSLSIAVRTPKYYHFDRQNANHLLEFLPRGITLRDFIPKYYTTDTDESSELAEARKIGKALGSWLKGFNQVAVDHAELNAVADKNKLGSYLRHLVNFGWLKDRVEQFPALLGDVKDILADVAQSAAAEISDPSKCRVTHGDFWTGNILLPDAPMPQDENRNVTLFVVDWEGVHLNVEGVDFGQMIAELYFFWVFESLPAGLWMAEAMVEAYGEVTEEVAYRTCIQIGSHLICIMTEVHRLPVEQYEKAVAVGKDFLVHAWNKDRAWFEKSELACIFRQVK